MGMDQQQLRRLQLILQPFMLRRTKKVQNMFFGLVFFQTAHQILVACLEGYSCFLGCSKGFIRRNHPVSLQLIL